MRWARAVVSTTAAGRTARAAVTSSLRMRRPSARRTAFYVYTIYGTISSRMRRTGRGAARCAGGGGGADCRDQDVVDLVAAGLAGRETLGARVHRDADHAAPGEQHDRRGDRAAFAEPAGAGAAVRGRGDLGLA